MSVSAARQLRHLRVVGLAGLGALIIAAAAYGGWHLKLACSPSCAMVTMPPWMVVAAIIFVAAAISSTVGFAFSAIAGAMILHAVPNGVEAVQIMMIASIGIQAYSVANLGGRYWPGQGACRLRGQLHGRRPSGRRGRGPS